MLVTVRSSVVIRATSCVINSLTSRAHTSLYSRNEAFYASKRSYFTGVKRLTERDRLLLRQGVRGLLATLRACPKYLTGLPKIPYGYTQNRLFLWVLSFLISLYYYSLITANIRIISDNCKFSCIYQLFCVILQAKKKKRIRNMLRIAVQSKGRLFDDTIEIC